MWTWECLRPSVGIQKLVEFPQLHGSREGRKSACTLVAYIIRSSFEINRLWVLRFMLQNGLSFSSVLLRSWRFNFHINSEIPWKKLYLPTPAALVTLGLHRRMLYWQQEAPPQFVEGIEGHQCLNENWLLFLYPDFDLNTKDICPGLKPHFCNSQCLLMPDGFYSLWTQ